MLRILLVKTSSLGDVVHNLPVASDVAAAFPGAEIDWVVEESFSALPALHASVDRVISVALRRWRARLTHSSTWREIRAFSRELRVSRYDAVIDTQGLFKSAIIARAADGRRFGLGWRASREPLFPFYDRTIDVPRALHAVERNRSLAAQALGYAPPHRVDYAIRAPESTRSWFDGVPYAVLMHATSARAKLWPEEHWIELGTALAEEGLCCVLPWGSDEERVRSERLSASIPRALTPPRMTLAQVVSLLGGARCGIGVDTGLTHLCGALGVPTVGLYVSTDPAATGLHGCPRAINVGRNGFSPASDDVLQALRQLSR